MADFAILVQKDKEEWKSRAEANSETEYKENPDLRNGNPFQPIDQIVVSTVCLYLHYSNEIALLYICKYF